MPIPLIARAGIAVCAISLAAAATAPVHAVTVDTSAFAREWSRAGAWTEVPLITDASHTFLIAEAEIAGKKCRLMVDTGAAMTCLSQEGAARLGLAPVAAAGEAQGVGGTMAKRKAASPAWKIGPMTLPERDFTVLPLSVLNNASQWGGEAPVGVIGSDLLDREHLVVDVAGARLLRPGAMTTTELDAVAKAAGLVCGELDKSVLLPVTTVRFGERPVRLLLDTGARSLVLDEKLARAMNYTRYPGLGSLSGAAGRVSPPVVTVENFNLGPARFHYAGANVMDLSVFPEKIEGIVGVDMQHACGLIFDYRFRRVYFQAGTIAADQLGAGGPMPLSHIAVISKIKNSRAIIQGAPIEWERLGDMTDEQGREYARFAVTYRIDAVITGAGQAGENCRFAILVPKSQSRLEDLRARSAANEFSMLFFPKTDTPTTLDTALCKISAARIAQIKILIQEPKKSSAPAKVSADKNHHK